MSQTMLKYEMPKVEWCSVTAESGYAVSFDVTLPEIDGTKEEGEW